jgi:ribosomal protein L7Ae-like RNA K-turn-binding protein
VDKALNFLGICKKAGVLMTGENGVGSAARSGKAVLIMTASDTAQNTLKKAKNLAEMSNALLLALPYEKDALGELLGKNVCALIAITDKGLAAAFADKLAAEYGTPEYIEILAALKVKSARRGRKING